MISSSQISFFQENTRQVSAFDSSQLRIRQQAPQNNGNSENSRGSELTLLREAAYRYSSQEQLAFSSSAEVTGDNRSAVFTTDQLVEKSSELFLMGQQAITISRAALGSDAGVQGQGSLSVSAGKYMFYSESESRSFASTGTIELDNGDSIDFTLSLRQSQSRSYEYSELIKIQERPMTDPLVINFGATTAQLTDTLFEFDMTGNGDTAHFATLGSGSGYLVLDRNDNGKVDDGTELFGPQSGSGFGELAAYDDDGNRWIDANDEIFQSLAVWVQTADGNDELRSLDEVGVQALYVDNADDRFTLANGQGVPLGQIKASGIYLTTDGDVRTLEEIDLAEQNTEQAPAAEEVLSSSSPETRRARGNSGLAEARVEAIRAALKKLNEIREKQKAFIEKSKDMAKEKSPLDDYFKIIDKLRLELLNSQDEKKQAASRYLEFAKA
ncbi:hypothetical protein FWJ25_03520 [Marinobacter salinexigens]|uniref:VCBS repeat-containing protein n=1 Tax=Marinobacter salinexigens TaxID=2919747 RepID=A0A5B0VP85_9GAMM|nr:hypothetical protein [Marinobacter salinexigens]KAA1176214.1 hypothetical protein FWJ25_03520 [Marinobacter salinexigens]